MIQEKLLIILYVKDQQRSKEFYSKILEREPVLDVQGMTEFEINKSCSLGLMPENVIAKILIYKTPHPVTGNGIPRCELYLLTDDIDESFQNAIDAGAKEVSKIQKRNWGDTVGYLSDPDGHIIAFANRD